MTLEWFRSRLGTAADALGAALTCCGGKKVRVVVTVGLVKLMPPSQLNASGTIFHSI